MKRNLERSKAVARAHASWKTYLVLLVLPAAFLAIPTAHASGEIIIHLAGPGAGKVVSNPPGIECSNIAGEEEESVTDCSESYAPAIIELSPTPGSGFAFGGWNGNDVFGFNFGSSSCNAGTAEPCLVVDSSFAMEGAPVEITATFNCAPPIASPLVNTGDAGAGGDVPLRTLEGTVNPEGCGLEESYFEYGPTIEYGSTTPTEPDAKGIGKGASAVPVSAETEPLEPETTYHYRLVATNVGGVSKGADHTFTTGPAMVGGCPNEARRQEQGIVALLLPDCMALEMVSPQQKAGSPAKEPNVSGNGSRVSFRSSAALGEKPGGLSNDVTYVASRHKSGESGEGWSSESTWPDKGFSALWEDQSKFHPSFTPTFSRWFGIGATGEQLPQGIAQAYEAGLNGFFTPLSEPKAPLSTSTGTPNRDYLGEVVYDSVFQGASADGSHLYFKPGARATYFPYDPDPGPDRGANVYLARVGASGEPVLELLQHDRTGKVWGGECGARLGGIGSAASGKPAPNGLRNQGAVSADGSVTYFSARVTQPQSGGCDETANKLRILERRETATGPQIFPLFSSECSRPTLPDPPGSCQQLGGDDFYQGASLDQSKVYFTTNRQLASSDLDGSNVECSVLSAVAGCDLYLYDRSRPVGERLVQVSAGEELGPGVHEAGMEAKVYNGITAISADGSHVYFAAQGVLTDGVNPQGATAQPGKPNLYTWDAESEQMSFLGTLAAPLSLSDPGDAIIFSDEGDGLWGGQGTWRNNAYPVPVLSPAEQSGEGGVEGGDGHILVFESRAELTANDADGRRLDVYRYDAVGPSLACLSCAPGSSVEEPDEKPFDVDPRGDFTPLGTDFAESRRWVSEDGEEVGFMTAEPLLPGDVDGAKNSYLWQQGSLARLPGKAFLSAQLAGPFLSHDGSTVAFATATPLLLRDGDKSADVYVARVGGGFPEPPPPPPCEPGSPGNDCQPPPPPPPPPPRVASEVVGPGNPKHHLCRKGKVRRHGRCMPRHSRHAPKRHHNRHANTHRRAGK